MQKHWRRFVLARQGAGPGIHSTLQTLPKLSPTEPGEAEAVCPESVQGVHASLSHHTLGEQVLLQNVLNLELKTIAEGNTKVRTCCTAVTVSLTPGGLLSCLLEVIP